MILDFSAGRRLPIIFQTEAAECGIACIAMVASYYGGHIGLIDLRKQNYVSMTGSTFNGLISMSTELGFTSRAIKIDIECLGEIKLPSILHWDLNHFVVLKSVGKNSITIHDPERGARKLNYEQVSKHFTGMALELWPCDSFAQHERKREVRLFDIFSLSGVGNSFFRLIALSFGLEVMTLLSPIFMQLVFDDVIVSVDRSLLLVLSLAFACFLILARLITMLRAWSLMVLSRTLSLQWSVSVFSKLLKLPLSFFERRHFGDISNRFSSMTTITSTVTSSGVVALIDGTMAVVMVAVMFFYGWELAILAQAGIFFYIIVKLISYTYMHSAQQDSLASSARQQSFFYESLRAIKSIKIFQQQKQRLSHWLNYSVWQANNSMRVDKLNIFQSGVSGGLLGLSHILVIYVAAENVLNQELTVGGLIAFVSYKAMYESRISSFIDQLYNLRMLRLHASRLADIVLSESEPNEEFEYVDESGVCAIQFGNVWFRYSRYEPFVLKGISFSVSEGEHVCIMGASGCGKTTLLNILLGSLEASEGEIVFLGNSGYGVNPRSARRSIATVLQDDTLLSGTLAENISFSASEPDMDRIRQCATLACIDTDIQRMPMKYNSLIGDMGATLSGGQKQRVLLARALYKQPKILIMDEATSNLDIKTEKMVSLSIKELKITRISIAHRLETAMRADRVIRIEKGIVISDLSCEEFLALA